MPRPPLPAAVLELLRRPRPAVIGVVRADGSPVTAATWYLWEDEPDHPAGGHVLVNVEAGRRRLDHLRGNPHVSLTVLDDSWYSHVTLLGTAVELSDDPDMSGIDRVSWHYLGAEYPVRDRPRVTVRIDVERWTVWNLQDTDG